jgi:hypothetical protein
MRIPRQITDIEPWKNLSKLRRIITETFLTKYLTRLTQSPRGWRRGSAVACLPGLRPIAVTGQSLIEASRTECGVSVIYTPQQRGGVGPSGAVGATRTKYLAHEVNIDVTEWLNYIILRKKTIRAELFTRWCSWGFRSSSTRVRVAE